MVQGKLRFALASMLVCLMTAGGGVARAATPLPPPQYAFDCSGWPVIISQPGSYVLTANLVLPCGSKDAIDITADNVTLDLGGYSIIGTGAGTGIGVSGISHSNITVKNGSVVKMGGTGITLGANATVQDVTSSGSVTGDGIQIVNGIVRHVHANGNHFLGISTITISNDTSTIADSYASNNGGGIYVSSATISGSTANDNVEDGINCRNSSVLGNTTLHNRQSGIACINGTSTISNNTSNNNSAFGIAGRGQIFNNAVSTNGSYGIETFDGPSSVIGNSVGNNTGIGIQADPDTSVGNNQLYHNDGVTSGNAGQISGGVVITPNICNGSPC